MMKQSASTFLKTFNRLCGNDTAKSISEFSITSSGRRFVEINLVETTLSRMRPSPGRYEIRSNTSSTATYMYMYKLCRNRQ